jgi:hypothetical protein
MSPDRGGRRCYLNERELAERWGVSVRTIQKMRGTGGGPRYRKFNSSVRYAIEDVEAFEDNAARVSTSDPGRTMP